MRGDGHAKAGVGLCAEDTEHSRGSWGLEGEARAAMQGLREQHKDVNERHKVIRLNCDGENTRM